MKNPINYNPKVNLDKTNWSLEDKNSFYGIVDKLNTFFNKVDIPETAPSLPGHQRARSYRNGRYSITVFFLQNKSVEPRLRLVFKPTKDIHLPSIRAIKKYLVKKNCLVTFTKNKTCLNVNFPEFSGIQNSNSLVERVNKRVAGVMKNEQKRKALLESLNIVLTKLGYRFISEGPVKSKPDSNQYKNRIVFITPWFRINVNSFPRDSFLPYAVFQFDEFSKSKHSYWGLLFVLTILSSNKIITKEGSAVVTVVRPSSAEVAFDFYDNEPEFLFEIHSSLNANKKICKWSNETKASLNEYSPDDTLDLWLEASHYLGQKTDTNYQIATYNRLNFTRLEFRVEHKGLRPDDKNKLLKLKEKGLETINLYCVSDFFNKNWISEFEKKINFYKLRKQAFKIVDSANHYLAKICLREFILRVPKEQKSNFNRNCLVEHTELKQSVTTAGNEFFNWLNNFYMNASILIIKYDGLNIEDDSFEDFISGSILPPRSQPLDLINLCRELPLDASVTTHEHEQFIRFRIGDNKDNLLANVLVGDFSGLSIDTRNRYSIENIKDIFPKKP